MFSFFFKSKGVSIMTQKFNKTGEKLRAIISQVVRFRWISLLLVVLLTMFFMSNMKNLVFDSSADIWFVEGDESVQIMKEFEDSFGNDDFVSVFLKADKSGKFTPEMLRQFQEISYRLEESVPYLKKLTWLGNVEWIESNEEGLKIEGFIPDIPNDQSVIDALLDKALTEESYVNAMLNADKDLIPLHMELYKYKGNDEDKNPRYSVAKAIYKVLEDEKYKNLEMITLGGPAGQYQYDQLVALDGKRFFLMTVVIMLVLMAWVGRGVRGVLIPVLVVVLPVFWTLGAIPFMGITINFLTMSLSTILICVGIADSMHYISAFHDYADVGVDRKKSLLDGVGLVGRAILLTTLTTAIGFLSFLATDVKPFREMGLYVSLGVVFAMLATFFLVPSIYSFGKEKVKPMKRRAEGRMDLFDKMLDGVYRLVINYPKSIVIVFLVISVVSVYGMSLAKVESNTLKLIKTGNEYRDNLDYIGDKMGGVMSLEFMVNTGRDDGVKTAEFMKKLDEFHNSLEDLNEVSKVTSITSVLKKMRKALHNNDESYYAIPDKDDAVSQYLFMYETSGGDEMDKMISFSSDRVRVTAKTSSISTGECRLIHDFAVAKAKELFGDDVTVVMSGGVYRFLRLNDILGEGQKSSFIAALLAIGLVMIFLMRSLKLGLISMLPNVFPVIISLGLIGLMGVYIDVILMSFAPVIIGVAVDDTIHFFTRFRKEFDAGNGYEESLRKTYMTVGRPIIFTTMVLVLGFSPFIFSQLTGYVKNGFMMGWAFSWALLADFLFAPALIMLTKPLGKDKGVE